MAVMTLTDAIVKSAKCDNQKRIELCDTVVKGLLLEVRPSGSATYSVRYKKDGQTKYAPIGSSSIVTLAEARKRAKAIRAEIALGADPRGELKKQRQMLTLEEFWTKHYTVYAAPRKRSFNRDEQLWRIRIQPKFGKMRLNQITRHQVQTFHTALLAEGLAPASCDHHLKLMKYMFNLAHDWELYEGPNPIARVPLFNADNKVQNILSDTELKKLVTVLQTDENRPVCLIIQWLLCTGMRLGATLEIRWDQLDRNRRVLVIPSTISKSKRNASIPLNDSAMAILDQLDTEGTYDHLFINPKTERPFVNVTKSWNRIRKQAGLPHFRLHDGRHTYASLLACSGVSLYVIQNLLNHQSPVTSQRYSHLSPETLLRASNNASAAIQTLMPINPITIESTAVEIQDVTEAEALPAPAESVVVEGVAEAKPDVRLAA